MDNHPGRFFTSAGRHVVNYRLGNQTLDSILLVHIPLLFCISFGRGEAPVGSVRLHAVALEHAENTRAALVAAHLPDIVDGVAGLVHVYNRLLAVQPKRGLGPFLLVLLPGVEDPGLRPARCCGLRRDEADCV